MIRFDWVDSIRLRESSETGRRRNRWRWVEIEYPPQKRQRDWSLKS